MLVTKAILSAVATGFCLGSAQAETADPSGGFTFKRVTVEKRPIGKRINVQITPEEDYYKNIVRKKPVEEKDMEKEIASVARPPADLSEWFWDDISPDLAKASSGRLDAALRKMQKSPGKMAALSPNLGHFQNLADQYGSNILMATLGKQVSPAFVLAVIGVESSGRTDAVSSAGAVGLMQLIPATAERFDVKDSSDPQQNISGGAAYLEWLLKEFNNDPLLALAGYNAGENAVKKHSGVPPFAETRAYVPKVVAAWQVSRALCMTPPKYVTDGCVFKSRNTK
ncbi:MAG: lytic transglycosylase domain-containing protein [Rhodobacteraceae bacterium]|nr:lytic transglycosylase domain-containing protein [Paracoccaceae bacterium]